MPTSSDPAPAASAQPAPSARARARVLQQSTSENEGAFTVADWGLFASVSLIWGASFLFIDIGLDSLEPGLITLGRVGLGALVLNLLPAARCRIEPEDRFRMLVLSVAWVAVPFTLFPIAEQYINSAVTGMLNGGTPIFTAIVAGVLLRQVPGRAQLAGLVVGLAGVVLISVSQASEGGNAWIGVVLVVGATICYGFATNVAAPLQATYGSLAVMARMLALATLWTLPFGLVSVPGSRMEAGPVLAVAALGAVGTGAAFAIMGRLVSRVGPTRAVFITYLVPVVALLLGVALRDDDVTAAAGVGIVAVIAGAVLASRDQRRHPGPIAALDAGELRDPAQGRVVDDPV